MRTPTTAALLGAWERAAPLLSAQRALELLGAACPDMSAEELARLPVGRRDALLMEVRERAFGRRVTGLANCPACREEVELVFDLGAVRVDPAPHAGPLLVRHGGYEVRFRLVDGDDLGSLFPGAGEGVRRLLERCVLEAHREGEAVPPASLPAEVVAAVAEEMERQDPQARVELATECPACHRRWLTTFDIASFLWAEVAGWAHTLLRDVHVLARAYGWSEDAILAMRPWKRQRYLEMCAG